MTNKWYVDLATVIISSVLALLVVDLVSRKSADTAESLKNFTLLTGVLLICWMGVDIGFKAFRNSSSSFSFDANTLMTGRKSDPNMWARELYPTIYAPTNDNFVLYKPFQRVSGRTFGATYYPALLKHPLLKEKVLEPKDVTYSIDSYGLRNNADPARARIAILGDSFVFGSHLTDEKIFTSRMARLLSEPIYNLGVEDTSPRQQLYLIKYLLRTYPDIFRLRRLLWLIFEGNDLEDDYSPTAPRTGYKSKIDHERRSAFKNTLVQSIKDIPRAIRQQSIARAFTTGKIHLAGLRRGNSDRSHYILNGEVLAQPLYQSKRFGHRLFHQPYIDRARKPADYVRDHPNLPRLASTIEEMAELANLNGFDVTIVTTPSAARLYGQEFGLKGISQEPNFIQAVAKIAAEQHIAYLDLYTLLLPEAEDELLYQRDDSHWNERGHEVVASLLSSYLRR